MRDISPFMKHLGHYVLLITLWDKTALLYLYSIEFICHEDLQSVNVSAWNLIEKLIASADNLYHLQLALKEKNEEKVRGERWNSFKMVAFPQKKIETTGSVGIFPEKHTIVGWAVTIRNA